MHPVVTMDFAHTLLVVTTSDLEEVTLEFITKAVTSDLTQRNFPISNFVQQPATNIFLV